MKKNISKLIAQVQRSTTSKREGFKVTCNNANHYANKILVDKDALHEAGIAQKFVKEEMQLFQREEGEHNSKVAELNESMKRRTERRPLGLEHQLNAIDRNFSPLSLEELMEGIRTASNKERLDVRDKLTKLEMSLSFRLETEELDTHIKEILEDFLLELTEIINKASRADKIY